MKTTRTAEGYQAWDETITRRDAAYRAENAALDAGDMNAYWKARHAKERAQAELDQFRH